MLTGRTAELEDLKGYYGKAGSCLLILYGQKYIGKTAVLREFTRGKPCHYHMARACSGNEHLLALKDLEKQAGNPGKDKAVVIVEEFQRMVRMGEAVTEALFALPQAAGEQGVMVVLTSSCIRWVENAMVSRIGNAARGISGVFKLKELGFFHLREYFPDYGVRQCMEVYAMLGGVAGWWECFDRRLSVKENVCRNILAKTGRLHEAPEYLMAEELRELSVYNTILAALATGKEKLNDLYRHTGFSRAKLSVYLGNLIGMNLVEKVFSYECPDAGGTKDGAKKGLYRICNDYVKFYYTYLYGGADRLFQMSPERYYNTYILPDRDRYMQDAFRRVCMQHMERCAGEGCLPLQPERMGSWFGKKGSIDIVVQDTQGHTLLARCMASRMGMAYTDYRKLLETAQDAGLRTDYIWLYAELFDERIVWEAEGKESLTLVDIRKL